MNFQPAPYYYTPPPDPYQDQIDQLQRELLGVFAVRFVEKHHNRKGITFGGEFLGDVQASFEELRERFDALGYTLLLRRRKKDDLVVALEGNVRRAGAGNPLLNLLLLVATIFTTLAAGASLGGVNIWGMVLAGQWSQVMEAAQTGVPFAGSLLAILGVHELGHYVAARWHGVTATLPYFIPFPFSGLGTLGAFISLRSAMKDRRVLFDIGIAGPLAGFVVAVPILLLGLSLSPVVPLRTRSLLNLDFAGTSILLDVVIGLLKPLNPNETLLMHPILFAAWIGMLITGINLLPVGQLDGGHIAYALIGRHAYILALIFFGGLIAAGFILSPNWLVWAFFVMFGGLRHPPPSNDITGLDWPRRLLGLGSIVLFIIVVIPAPFGS